jgi:hypothetical protein
MKTVLYKVRLFNDKVYKHRHHIYMKWKEGEREQDSGEKERECVREAEHCRKRKVASVIK